MVDLSQSVVAVEHPWLIVSCSTLRQQHFDYYLDLEVLAELKKGDNKVFVVGNGNWSHVPITTDKLHFFKLQKQACVIFINQQGLSRIKFLGNLVVHLDVFLVNGFAQVLHFELLKVEEF